jgi:hypothetical protein
MRKLVELDSVAAVEEVAARVVIAPSDASLVILRRGIPGNDAACEDAAISDAEAWARHALAANGFGDPAITITDAPSAWPPLAANSTPAGGAK